MTLDCRFDIEIDPNYYCQLPWPSLLVSSNDDREITEVEGQHLQGKSNSDVKAFYSNGNTVNYFPRGLTKFFKNIEKVQIAYGNLKEISKEDLKEFGDKLKVLIFQSNEIKIIDADLFIFNRNLEHISFAVNNIKQIGSGAFNGLQKLVKLELRENSCIFDSAEIMDPSNIAEIIKEVDEKCKIKENKS